MLPVSVSPVLLLIIVPAGMNGKLGMQGLSAEDLNAFPADFKNHFNPNLLPRTLQRPLGKKVVGESGVVPDAFDREFGPVVRLSVFHVDPERGGYPVDDPDVPEGPRA